MHAFRNQQRGRSHNRGRGATGGRPYSYGHNHPEATASTSRQLYDGPTSTREPKLVCRDVYLVDVDVTNAPRGTKWAPLFQNGQIKTAFKLESALSEREFAERIEREFKDILDLSKPTPR
eukprot:Seg3902.1 transcript_id=Seg3902.1/GoldUCD/mRNA.D3Y31 product="hypothetical protein" protein_id=Seg3902.1/GoldUCD/D3Y31